MGESLIQPTLVGPPIDPMECATFLDRTSVPEGAGMVRGPAGAPAGVNPYGRTRFPTGTVPKVPGGTGRPPLGDRTVPRKGTEGTGSP